MKIIIVVLAIILLLYLRNKVASYIEKLVFTCNNVKTAIKYRNYLKWIGIIWTLIFITLIVILLLVINSNISYWTDGRGKPVLVVLLGSLFYKKGYKLLAGNVSSYTVAKYLKQKKHFVLFLRGFEDDDYNVSLPKDYDFLSFTKFNENSFAYVAEPYFDICAIGMTKEAYAPFGGDRIYVDDDTWKEDVKLLMNKASFILILMNDRDSCIWEIAQCKDKLEKTIFFVSDLNKYNCIRERLIGVIEFPEIKNSDEALSCYIEFGKGKEDKLVGHVIRMEHNEEEYKLLIEYLVELKGVHKKPSPWIKVIKWFGLIFVTIVFLSLLISLYDAFMSFLNINSIFLQILVVVILSLLGWVMYMLVKVSVIQWRKD